MKSVHSDVDTLTERLAHQQRELDETRRREHLLRAVLDHALGGYVLMDALGRVTATSSAKSLPLGRLPVELIGQPCLDHTHPDDLPLAREMFARLLERPDEPVRVRLRQRHADGHWLCLECTGRNLLADAAVGAILAGWYDVTAEVEAERRHREETELYRRLVEGVQAIPWE